MMEISGPETVHQCYQYEPLSHGYLIFSFPDSILNE